MISISKALTSPSKRAKLSSFELDRTQYSTDQSSGIVTSKIPIKTLLNRLHKVVDNETFYESVEVIFQESDNPINLAKCAELVSKRDPGGAFYRARLWARIAVLICQGADQHSGKLKLNQVFEYINLSPNIAKSYIAQGQLIQLLEDELGDVKILREISVEVLQNAIRQKDRAQKYLSEAAYLLSQEPAMSPTKIHRAWCEKNGSIKSNLDIIKPSDWWAFSHPKWPREEDFFGSIPGEVYANALYYFAPRTGLAVDPMAGSGMLKRVYNDRGKWQKDSDFKLKIQLFDLYPRRRFIKKHDACQTLPVKADWIFIDPPYFGQSSHLFKGELSQTDDYDNYLSIMEKVIHALNQSLNIHGRLCIFLPKWSGYNTEDENYNVPSDISDIAIESGLSWLDVAYVSRARQQEQGSALKNISAKENRRMRSDTCVLNVFEKTRG
jgi:hypothetical protein